MKKWIITIFIILLTISILTACGETPQPEEKPLELLTTKLRATSYPITISGEMTTAQEVFHSEYIVNKVNDTLTASYTYEQAAKIEITAEGNIVMPDSAVETKTGSISVRNGNIVEKNGEECNLAISMFHTNLMTLDDQYLSNVVIGDGVMSAKVTDAKNALGFKTTATNVEMRVWYTDTAVTSMLIEYDASDVHVALNYKFGQ